MNHQELAKAIFKASNLKGEFRLRSGQISNEYFDKYLKVLVVEDVITSGGQIIESVKKLRDFGAIITTVLCVIDKESGGKENLEQNGLCLLPLFSISELHAAAANLSL